MHREDLAAVLDHDAMGNWLSVMSKSLTLSSPQPVTIWFSCASLHVMSKRASLVSNLGGVSMPYRIWGHCPPFLRHDAVRGHIGVCTAGCCLQAKADSGRGRDPRIIERAVLYAVAIEAFGLELEHGGARLYLPAAAQESGSGTWAIGVCLAVRPNGQMC